VRIGEQWKRLGSGCPWNYGSLPDQKIKIKRKILWKESHLVGKSAADQRSTRWLVRPPSGWIIGWNGWPGTGRWDASRSLESVAEKVKDGMSIDRLRKEAAGKAMDGGPRYRTPGCRPVRGSEGRRRMVGTGCPTKAGGSHRPTEITLEGRIRIVCTTAARLPPQSRPRRVRPCQGDTPWTPRGWHDQIRIKSRRLHSG